MLVPTVDLSHPLAAGLGAAAYGPFVVFPTRRVISAGAGWADGKYGRAFSIANQNVGVAMCDFPAQTDTSSFTLALIAETATSEAGIGYRSGGGPGTSFIKLTPGDASAAKPKLNYHVNGVSRAQTSPTTYAGQAVSVGVKEALKLNVWVNGVRETDATFTTGQLTVNAAACFWGPDETVVASTSLLAGYFWPNRGLTASEIQLLCAKPLALLKGLR